MRAVFADTFYWIALINFRDEAHGAVVEYSRSLGTTKVVTTDEVLTELLAYCASDLQLRQVAAVTVQDLLSDDQVWVIPQTRASFQRGLEMYKARPVKGYCLVDCISMQTIREQGLNEVLTGDRHFKQEGFRALFRP